MPYVRSLTDVLSGYLDWHLSRLKLMARFTSSVLTLTTTDLWKISLALKATPKQESDYRRIQRFLSEYAVDFTALGGLLLHLLPQSPPYEVVIDRTEWYFGETAVNILMVGIAHVGMAFPIAWSALENGGSSALKAQTEVLERFLKVVDPDSIEVVTADPLSDHDGALPAPWAMHINRLSPVGLGPENDSPDPDGKAGCAREYASDDHSADQAISLLDLNGRGLQLLDCDEGIKWSPLVSRNGLKLEGISPDMKHAIVVPEGGDVNPRPIGPLRCSEWPTGPTEREVVCRVALDSAAPPFVVVIVAGEYHVNLCLYGQGIEQGSNSRLPVPDGRHFGVGRLMNEQKTPRRLRPGIGAKLVHQPPVLLRSGLDVDGKVLVRVDGDESRVAVGPGFVIQVFAVACVASEVARMEVVVESVVVVVARNQVHRDLGGQRIEDVHKLTPRAGIAPIGDVVPYSDREDLRFAPHRMDNLPKDPPSVLAIAPRSEPEVTRMATRGGLGLRFEGMPRGSALSGIHSIVDRRVGRKVS
jgi:hypothetical protein